MSIIVHSLTKKTISDLARTIRLVPVNGGLIGRSFQLTKNNDGTFKVEDRHKNKIVIDVIYSYRAGSAIIFRKELQKDERAISLILDEDWHLHNALFDMKLFKSRSDELTGADSDIYYARYLKSKDTVRRLATRLDKYVPNNIF